jgi:YHS domain-containing protein
MSADAWRAMNVAIDPVCGMEVDEQGAAAAWDHEGTVYLFCSVGCMESFRADPDRYLGMDPSDRSMGEA